MAAPPGVEDGYTIAFESLNALDVLQQLAEVPDMADRAPIVVARFARSVQAFDQVLDGLLPIARSASRSRAPIKACGQSGRSWIEIMHDVARARYGWLISEEDFEPWMAFLSGELPPRFDQVPWAVFAGKIAGDPILCDELAAGLGVEFDEIEASKGGDRETERVDWLRCSIDCRCVRWGLGEPFTFSKNQAAVVKLLHEHLLAGTPDVGGDTLLSEAEISQNRLDTVFRDSHGSSHEAWGTMIVPGSSKGTYRLAPPKSASRPKKKSRSAK
jgi:hypothetical protein